MEFGKILKKARLTSGLNQGELAAKLYLSQSNISRLENDSLELKAADLINWFQSTNPPVELVVELITPLLVGVDIGLLIELLSNLTSLSKILLFIF